MSLRAVPPLNRDAIQKADDQFYAAHPEYVRPDGTRVPLSANDPKQEALRQEWLASYGANGGKVAGTPVAPKPPDNPVGPCPIKKTVTAKIVSLTFRSDHADGAGKKQLRPSAGDYKDANSDFAKPEWQASPSKSDPISHTKNLEVKVDVDIEFTVDPPGCSASLSKVAGAAADAYLTFEKADARAVTTGVQKFTGLVSKGKLPNQVDLLKGKSIAWKVTVDGEEKSAGSSGPHKIYVTFAQPSGKIQSTVANLFDEGGPVQDVTEERLKYSVDAAKGVGIADEKECVDAVFRKMLDLGVNYTLGFVWTPDPNPNDTGMTGGPLKDGKPTLHHYLWRCNLGNSGSPVVGGECHNIAASFALACRILGVKDPFEIGYMYPWPSRKENPPKYDKRGDSILGKYGTDGTLSTSGGARYGRAHSGEGHGNEILVFFDGSHRPNNFEGVAKYRTAILYAIGDAVFDQTSDPNQNASVYYSVRTWGPGGTVASFDLSKGFFELGFVNGAWCKKPYPWKTHVVDYEQPPETPGGPPGHVIFAPFHWHD